MGRLLMPDAEDFGGIAEVMLIVQDRALLNAIGNLELTGLNAEALSKLGHKLEDVACQINFPEAKKIFLSKVHQYIKDRLLDAKYSCALMLNIFESKADEFAEGKQYLVDIIQMLQQTKAREQSDVNSAVTYPEYILPYLVHALAHNSCPNIDECKEVETYDNIYRLKLLMRKWELDFWALVSSQSGDSKTYL